MSFILFQGLEDNIVTFVKNELKKMQNHLNAESPESQREDVKILDSEDEEQRRIIGEALLQITVYFLRTMKLEDLAACLESSKRISFHKCTI